MNPCDQLHNAVTLEVTIHPIGSIAAGAAGQLTKRSEHCLNTSQIRCASSKIAVDYINEENRQMVMADLLTHIRALATLPETDDPVISCYMTLENRRLKHPNLFDQQIRCLSVGVTENARRKLEDALKYVWAFLDHRISPEVKGAAIFSRAGKNPFCLTLRFHVPVPTWIAVDKAPNIYHLVEMKDTYEHYVVMLATKRLVRIIEMNVGSVMRRLEAEMPQSPIIAGCKYTKDHYQKRLKEHEHRFIKEQIQVLERLVTAHEHTHVILAGHPTMTTRVRERLSRNLRARLVDVVRAPNSFLIQATIAAFITAEEQGSQYVAENLARQAHSGGLAAIGTAVCYEALRRKQADSLVLLKAYAPGQRWICSACDCLKPDAKHFTTCPECGCNELVYRDIKEKMVRLAEKQHCGVEIVNDSEFLASAGGVGCLLRYRFDFEHSFNYAQM